MNTQDADNKDSGNQREISRQSFLKWGLFNVGKELLERLEAVTKPIQRRKFLRPPGAQTEPLFLSLCTHCDACTAACPYGAISVQYGEGFPHDGAPILHNLRESPCLLCEDMPCIAACPTEALSPVSHKEEVKIGTAVIDRLSCSAFYGTGCRTCYDVCPVQDKAISLVEGLPFINPAACTGCGICEYHCPENPTAVKVFLISD